MFIALAHFLFWLTGGILLLNSAWIVAWLLLGVSILMIPFWIAVKYGQNRSNTFPALIFLVSFYPLMLIVVGPPIVQVNMISECRNVETEIMINDTSTNIILEQCRRKENYYDSNYGEWMIRQHRSMQ